MNKTLRIIPLALALILLLAGCAGGNAPADSSAPVASGTAAATAPAATSAAPAEPTAAADEERTTLVWFQNAHGVDPATDPVVQAISDELNVDFDLISIDDGEEAFQRLNLMLSTGDRIDLVTMDSIRAAVNTWAADDLMYAYEDLITPDAYPALYGNVFAKEYDTLMIEGKHYFRPMFVWSVRGYVIRQDWLDKVGKEIPTTLEEYQDVLHSFVYDDPDGNGQDDTYGMFVAEPAGANAFGFVARAFAQTAVWGGGWVVEDGAMKQLATSETDKSIYRYLKGLYDDGLINKSFVDEKDAAGKVEDLIAQNLLGTSDISQPANLYNKALEAGMTGEEITYLPPLTMQDGSQGILPKGGFWCVQLVPKSSENVDKALELMEWALSEQGRELTFVGLKGTHWSEYNDLGDGNRQYVIDQEAMGQDWNTSDYGFMHPLAWGAFNYCEGAYLPYSEFNYDGDQTLANVRRWMTSDMDTSFDTLVDWYQLNNQYAKADYFAGMIDERLQTPQILKDIELQWHTRLLVEDAAQFDTLWEEYVTEWNAAGGPEATAKGQTVWTEMGN